LNSVRQSYQMQFRDFQVQSPCPNGRRISQHVMPWFESVASVAVLLSVLWSCLVCVVRRAKSVGRGIDESEERNFYFCARGACCVHSASMMERIRKRLSKY
jgi:hypothetical protein